MKKHGTLPLKALVMMAMLAAISIILGKFLAIPGGNVMRFSFENLPIIFAGIAFGPIGGALVGTVADLIGCVMVGYVINPVVTAGAASIGLVSGLVFGILKRIAPKSTAVCVALTVTLAHLIGSVVIKTFGLAAFYEMPFFVLMLWRLLNYVIVGATEGFLLFFLLKNKRICKEISRFSALSETIVRRKGSGNDDVQ